MAKCKYCHEAISRLDKEVCPFCGGVRPLDGTDTSTQDVTKVIDQLDNPTKIKHRKRIVAAILAVVFGVFGAHYFYLGKVKKGLINLAICVGFIGVIGLIIFLCGMHKALAFLIPFFVIELGMFFFAYMFLTKHNIQDSHGEFLE